jgi:hypothetical protein
MKKKFVLAFLLFLLSVLPAHAQRNLIDDLRAERAKYGATMTDDQCAELVNAVAWLRRAEGWGVSGKSFGTHGTRHDGTPIAHDILHHQPSNRLYDVLVGAGAQSSPTWNDLGPNTQGNRPWTAPIAPRGAVEPTPVPTPTPPPAPAPAPPPPPVVDLTKVNAQLAELIAAISALDAHLDRVEAQVHAASADLLIVKSFAENPVPYRGRVFGATVTLTPVKP